LDIKHKKINKQHSKAIVGSAWHPADITPGSRLESIKSRNNGAQQTSVMGVSFPVLPHHFRKDKTKCQKNKYFYKTFVAF